MESSDPDEPKNASTIPSPPSFRFENNESTQSLLSRGGSGYESQYGSLFGSRFSLSDGSGVFISSLALTIIISAIAIVGIVLVAVIITLAVMLSSCEQQHSAFNLQKPRVADYCSSFQLNAELNNLQGWTVPLLCASHVSEYVQGGQYLRDFEEAVESARMYLKTVQTDNARRYAIVLDIDETALSNLPYYRDHHYGVGEFQDPMWSAWVRKAAAPAMGPLLGLYEELIIANWSIIFISERPETELNATIQNLVTAGYKDWTALILWPADELNLTVQSYKSSRRTELEKQGYEIKSSLGDQWSDIVGPAVGERTFKLPNPMYQIP